MMKTNIPYPILRVAVDLADTSTFLRAARAGLPGGWSCAGGWPASFAYPLAYLRFRRDRGDSEPTFNLYLLRTDPDTLSVVGIVPDTGAIESSERQAVLDDFRSSVLDLAETRRFPAVIVEPLFQSHDLTLSEPWRSPPPEVQKVLDHWSGLLNNGAGFHPFDQTDWQYFLVNLHLTKRSISFEWLIDAFALKHTIPECALLRLEEDFYSSMKLLDRHNEGLEFQQKVNLERSRANHQPPAAPEPACNGGLVAPKHPSEGGSSLS